MLPGHQRAVLGSPARSYNGSLGVITFLIRVIGSMTYPILFRIKFYMQTPLEKHPGPSIEEIHQIPQKR